VYAEAMGVLNALLPTSLWAEEGNMEEKESKGPYMAHTRHRGGDAFFPSEFPISSCLFSSSSSLRFCQVSSRSPFFASALYLP